MGGWLGRWGWVRATYRSRTSIIIIIWTKTYKKSVMGVGGKVSIPLRRTVGLATLAPHFNEFGV